MKDQNKIFTEKRFAKYTIDDYRVDNSIGDITLDELEDLAERLESKKSIKYISLISNSIDDIGVSFIAKALKISTALEVLKLGCNDIGDCGAIYLADALTVNNSLKEIHLYNNKIGNKGAIELIKALTKHSFIKMIDLQNNNITADVAPYVLEALKSNNLLRINIDIQDIQSPCKELIHKAKQINQHIILGSELTEKAQRITEYNNKKKKLYEEAIENYKKALNLDPNLTIIQSNLANCFENLNDYAQAIDMYNVILDQNSNPDMTRVYKLKIASCYNNIGKAEIALNIVNKILEQDKNNKTANEVKVAAAAQLMDQIAKAIDEKKYAQALAKYKIINSLNPDNKAVILNIATILHQLAIEDKKQVTKYNAKQLDEALVWIDKALIMDANDIAAKKVKARILNTIGVKLFNQKSYLESLDKAKEAAALNPDDSIITANIASTLYVLSINGKDDSNKYNKAQLDEALIWVNKTLNIDINNENAKNIRDLIFKAMGKKSYYGKKNYDNSTEESKTNINSGIDEKLESKIVEELKKQNEKNKADTTRKNIQEASAAGSDNSLSSIDEDELRTYWYSHEDIAKLSFALRQKYFTYESDSKIIGGEPYNPYRENQQDIFISEPYTCETFAENLKDSIERLTASGDEFKNCIAWNPSLIIIPILSYQDRHWRAVKVKIDYAQGKLHILFDDPYGGKSFPQDLKNIIKTEVITGAEILFNKHLGTNNFFTFVKSDIKIDVKDILQQGSTNSHDCAPIIMSNIEDYIRAEIKDRENDNYLITDNNHNIEYTIPSYDLKRASDIIKQQRGNDRNTYIRIEHGDNLIVTDDEHVKTEINETKRKSDDLNNKTPKENTRSEEAEYTSFNPYDPSTSEHYIYEQSKAGIFAYGGKADEISNNDDTSSLNDDDNQDYTGPDNPYKSGTRQHYIYEQSKTETFKSSTVIKSSSGSDTFGIKDKLNSKLDLQDKQTKKSTESKNLRKSNVFEHSVGSPELVSSKTKTTDTNINTPKSFKKATDKKNASHTRSNSSKSKGDKDLLTISSEVEELNKSSCNVAHLVYMFSPQGQGINVLRVNMSAIKTAFKSAAKGAAKSMFKNSATSGVTKMTEPVSGNVIEGFAKNNNGVFTSNSSSNTGNVNTSNMITKNAQQQQPVVQSFGDTKFLPYYSNTVIKQPPQSVVIKSNTSLDALDLEISNMKSNIIRDHKTGKVKGAADAQIHHIIHQKLKNHELFEKSGTNIEDRINKIILPTKKGAEVYNTNKSIHQGPHYKRVRENLEGKMDKVLQKGEMNDFTQDQYKEKFVPIIQEERGYLRSGVRKLNKNAQPHAKDLHEIIEDYIDIKDAKLKNNSDSSSKQKDDTELDKQGTNDKHTQLKKYNSLSNDNANDLCNFTGNNPTRETSFNIVKTVQSIMLIIDFTTPIWLKNMILALHHLKNMEKHFKLPSNDPAKFVIELKEVKAIDYKKVEIQDNQKLEQEFDENLERSTKEEKAQVRLEATGKMLTKIEDGDKLDQSLLQQILSELISNEKNNIEYDNLNSDDYNNEHYETKLSGFNKMLIESY